MVRGRGGISKQPLTGTGEEDKQNRKPKGGGGDVHYCLCDKLLFGSHNRPSWICGDVERRERCGGEVEGEEQQRGERQEGGGEGEEMGKAVGEKARSRHVSRQTVFQAVRTHTAQRSPDNDSSTAITILSAQLPPPPTPAPNITPPPPEHGYMYIQTHSGRCFASLDCVRLPANTGSVRFTAAVHDGRLRPRVRHP